MNACGAKGTGKEEVNHHNDRQSDELSKEEISQWQVEDVVHYFKNAQFTPTVIKCIQLEGIDGQVLLYLTEDDIRDFRYRLNYNLRFGELKKFWYIVAKLQHNVHSNVFSINNIKNSNARVNAGIRVNSTDYSPAHHRNVTVPPYHRSCALDSECECCALEVSSATDGCCVNIPPEFFKTAISLGYSFVVTWITSFVMVIVHERVPDMKKYPPLPDIFLDNVPMIPWAFHMCEITGTLLFTIWFCVCIFHKYRMVLLRRFFALAGTVFLLRCVTMLITSLSVPGTHLQCNQKDYAIDETEFSLTQALYLRMQRAYTIWSGLGMSIQGVRTCGDYMFSGHTVALTSLNFFITEYTPRNLYFLHTLTWLLNMFGIFFILAAHEHYSIDVFVAFYITSRLFLYYHTLANNQALMQRDSNRTRIWFPMFSYFESSVGGIIPNEFDSVYDVIQQLVQLVIGIKDTVMCTIRRLWLESSRVGISSRNVLFLPRSSNKQRNAATSTSWTACNSPTTSHRTQDWLNDTRPNTSINSKEDTYLSSCCTNAQATTSGYASSDYDNNDEPVPETHENQTNNNSLERLVSNKKEL